MADFIKMVYVSSLGNIFYVWLSSTYCCVNFNNSDWYQGEILNYSEAIVFLVNNRKMSLSCGYTFHIRKETISIFFLKKYINNLIIFFYINLRKLKIMLKWIRQLILYEQYELNTGCGKSAEFLRYLGNRILIMALQWVRL